MPSRQFARITIILTVLALAVPLRAAEPATANEAKTPQQAIDRAVEFLKTKGAKPDGSYSAFAGTGVTSVVTYALLRNGIGRNDPAVAKSLAYLESMAQPDGGVYAPKLTNQNYETSLAIMCFAEANQNHRYDQRIKAADKFLKDSQWGVSQKVEQSDPRWGGGGYGKHARPDLSNTSFLVEALKAAGNGPDDESMKRALVFVSRCQNLESEYNTTAFAGKNPDGGFYYTPAEKGESYAGTTADGGLRSYGSMTYAGLKSMLYAGVKADDPRVKAAVKWAQMHYTLDVNPGMPKGGEGLYYYYHTFAKALAATGLKTIADDKGVQHDWRKELQAALLSRQNADGSWANKEPRWLESDTNLATGFALMALAYCRSDKE